MYRRGILALWCLALAPSWVPAAGKSAVSRYEFVARPCASQESARGAICGSVAVPESYAKPRGRKIQLNVMVFPSSAAGGEKGAQFDLEGGPGFAVTDSAAFYASDGVAYHEHRDVVLVDMRGTGGSNALRCHAIEARSRDAPAAPLYPPDLVADCARGLEATADVRQYSTAAAALDSCMDAMILRFVETLSTSDIDASCVAGMSRGGFAAPG